MHEINHINPHDPAWHQADTLDERLPLAAADDHEARFDSTLAEERLQRWCSQAPFHDPEMLARRFTEAGVEPETLRHLLGEPACALQDRQSGQPPWLQSMVEAYTAPATAPLQENDYEGPGSGLLAVVRPLVESVRSRLGRHAAVLARGGDVQLDPRAITNGLIGKGLKPGLLSMLSRTLTLELHVARLQGKLNGGDPEQRFASFVELLGQSETAMALFREYPVLARQSVIFAEQWLVVVSELLTRLVADFDSLCAHLFGGDDPGPLVSIDMGAGDSHRQGHSVGIACFGSGRKAVYKPRSLAVEEHFQQLLLWINRRGELPPFRTIKILDRGDYGWVEFVDHASCRSLPEVERFYERQGAYLGLLYALEAMDFHFENLIAAGEHPILIDLESLFRPHIDEAEIRQASAAAGLRMSRSVLRVGLLPLRLWTSDVSEGIDMSGLGALPGQMSPHEVPIWEMVGTDSMHIERRQMEIAAGDNRPLLDEEQIQVMDHASALERGFCGMYRLLLENRDELLAADSPLTAFNDDEIRVVLRPSMIYSLILQESFHPDVLRDALDRERLFDRLWVGVPQQPCLGRVVAAEREDLWFNDIPLFVTRSESCDLWTSRGRRLPGFFERSGMQMVRDCLAGLSEEDMERQRWFIRASFSAMALAEEAIELPAISVETGSEPALRSELLAAAGAVADRIALLAFEGENDASWIGISPVGDKRWSLLPLSADLYGGIPGVVLFLAFHGALTAHQHSTELARKGLVTVREQLQASGESPWLLGAYDGWGGVLYTYVQLAALWREPELLDEAEGYFSRIVPLVAEDRMADLFGGAAGAIAGALALHRARPSDACLDLAVRCGHRLLETVTDMDAGIGWPMQLSKDGPVLGGISHGAGGIAWQLLELAAVTGEASFREVALQALAYERSLFSPERQNWADLRDYKDLADDSHEHFMTAWCHGAPGIGISRLACLPHLDDEAIREEIAVCTRTTLAAGFGGNHSLCHGALGNLDFLLQASRALGDDDLEGLVYRSAGALLESIETEGWVCGVALGVETPGLMTGLAGIGYELLRLAMPDQVPSVLALESNTGRE
jgi:type 2 lantibiotic biosynthesis protein LanM